MDTRLQKNRENDRTVVSRLAKLLSLFIIKEKPDADCDFALQNKSEPELLINEINSAKTDWQTAQRELDNVNEKEIIDSCVYKMMSCRIRYEYLIKKAREKGISMDIKLSG